MIRSEIKKNVLIAIPDAIAIPTNPLLYSIFAGLKKVRKIRGIDNTFNKYTLSCLKNLSIAIGASIYQNRKRYSGYKNTDMI